MNNCLWRIIMYIMFLVNSVGLRWTSYIIHNYVIITLKTKTNEKKIYIYIYIYIVKKKIVIFFRIVGKKISYLTI